ncbi:hypothetical protein FACS1894190_00550 [Spirochaetia bacterium]|nr:hypothetical protein FACS1894190_00550 [Spirochaetia bacterium]
MGVFAYAQGEEAVWRQVLGGAVIAPPQVQNESVVMVCEGAAVKAFGTSGRSLWEYKTGGRLLPFLTRSTAGTSYVCRTNGILYAINRAGRLLWQQRLKENIIAAPLIGFDERIFLFFQKTISCRTASGNRLWQTNLESPIALPPIPDKKGGFIICLQDGSLLNFDATGATAGIPLHDVPQLVIALDDRRKSILTIFQDGSFKVVRDFKDGEGSDVLKGRMLAAGCFNNDVAVLLSSGEMTLWNEYKGFFKTFKTEDVNPNEKYNVQYNVQFNKNGIVVTSPNAAIAYNTNGGILWRVVPPHTSTALPAVDEEAGFVYYGGKDWLLYAFNTGAYNTIPFEAPHKVFTIKYDHEYGLGIPPDSTWPGFLGGGKKDFEELLKIIKYDLQKGDIGNNEGFYTKILLGIAGGKYQFSESLRPECLKQRLEAIKLLGVIGSHETMPFLSNLFLDERNYNVKAAIAETIGGIGSDNDKAAINAFATFINGPLEPSNERVLCAIAVATGKLCRFMGPPESAAGTALLSAIAEKSHSKIVHNAVKKEFDLLFRKQP